MSNQNPALGPDSFGPWVNVRHIGSGGQSHIFEGVRKDLSGKEIRAAIRVMQDVPGLTASKKAAFDEQFALEFRVLSKLKSIYIAPVLDFGLEPMPWIATKLISGVNLDEYLKRNGRLDPDTWLRFARQIIGGIHHAHKRRIVHLDLKPQNIMISKSKTAILIDFSSAAVVGGPLEGYQGGGFDFRFVAPERLGKIFTEKSDIFSLGVAFYVAATGKLPSWKILNEHSTEADVDVFFKEVMAGETSFPNMNPAQIALVKSMMSFYPADRPDSGEVLVALNRMIQANGGVRPGSKSAGNNSQPAHATRGTETITNGNQSKQSGFGCLVVFTPVFGFLYLLYKELFEKSKPVDPSVIRKVGLWASLYSIAGLGGWLLNFIWYSKTKKLLFAISGIVQLAFSAFFYLMLALKPNADGLYLSLSVWGAIITSVISTLFYTADK